MADMPEPFAFRARAYSAAHFEFEEVLTVNWPDAEAKLQSEYTAAMTTGHIRPPSTERFAGQVSR